MNNTGLTKERKEKEEKEEKEKIMRIVDWGLKIKI